MKIFEIYNSAEVNQRMYLSVKESLMHSIAGPHWAVRKDLTVPALLSKEAAKSCCSLVPLMKAL